MLSTGDLVLNIYVFALGILWALVMASAEGPIGWGGNGNIMKSNKWLFNCLKLFTFGRPLHPLPLFAIITFTISFAFPAIWNYSKDLPFSVLAWGELVAYFALFAIHEDFIWFLVNPHFGLKKFNKIDAAWHPRWFLGLPIDYWIGISVFGLFGFLGRGLNWVILTGITQLILVLITTLVLGKLMDYKKITE